MCGRMTRETFYMQEKNEHFVGDMMGAMFLYIGFIGQGRTEVEQIVESVQIFF